VVVQALLSEEAKSGNFKLAPRSDVMPKWHRRGIPEEMGEFAGEFRVLSKANIAEFSFPDFAESLIRCSPGEDATNGFFVSCFVRRVDPQLVDGIATSSKRKAEEELGESSEEENQPTEVIKGGGIIKKRKKKKKKRKPEEGL